MGEFLSAVNNSYPLSGTSIPDREVVRTPRTRNLRMPQGTTTEEFKAYLQQYEPETYRALEYFANKYPPRQLTEEELEELNNTKLKAFRPPTPKVCSRIWQTVKRWFTNEAPKIKLEDVQQAYDGYTAVTDAIEKINHTNTNINIRPFG